MVTKEMEEAFRRYSRTHLFREEQDLIIVGISRKSSTEKIPAKLVDNLLS
jgi:hypothetical protein